MTSEINRCYRVLELEPGASLEQVKQAWRELVKVWHPDRFPNDAKLQRKAQERLKEINLAYERLEEFLTSGTPPPHSRPSSSQSSDTAREQSRQRQESESKRTQTSPPPPSPSEQVGSEPKKSRAGMVWAAIAVIVVLVIWALSGGNSSRSKSSRSSSFGNPSDGGGSGFTPPPPQAFVPPPVSRALDEKNGFKDFRFGMTPQEAREILSPSSVTNQPGADAITFHYQATHANRIGDFSTDILSLSFFESHLYRMDVHFSNFQNEIFEAFKVNYGEPFDNDSWRRGDQKLRAKSWRGEKVSASILSSPGQVWDLLVIYNIEANQKAQEYAAKEPELAAKDFKATGFKSLVMGMKIQDLTVEFEVVEEDRVTTVKKVVFKKGDWRKVGFYPLRTLSAEFFKDRLYRIDLGFEDNRKEMFETFKQRFGPLKDNDTWTQGSMKLKTKASDNGKLFATILASSVSYGNDESWNAIVLLDVSVWSEVEQFKQDAPKRAAKDF